MGEWSFTSAFDLWSLYSEDKLPHVNGFGLVAEIESWPTAYLVVAIISRLILLVCMLNKEQRSHAVVFTAFIIIVVLYIHIFYNNKCLSYLYVNFTLILTPVLYIRYFTNMKCCSIVMINLPSDCVFLSKIICRHLTGEISQQWQETEEGPKREELLKLLNEIIPYLMGHNAEAEACDALMEVERLSDLQEHVDDHAYPRVCLYLKR